MMNIILIILFSLILKRECLHPEDINNFSFTLVHEFDMLMKKCIDAFFNIYFRFGCMSTETYENYFK